MATVKGVISYIKLSPAYTDRQRAYLIEQIEHANQMLKQKPKPTKIRNSNSPKLMSLQEWEERNNRSPLSTGLLGVWLRESHISPAIAAPLIEEFRMDMLAKNKQYADFRIAFQVYLTKGYLSMDMATARFKSKVDQDTSLNRRGGGL